MCAVLLSMARTCSHIRAVTTSGMSCSLANIWNPETVLRATEPPRRLCPRSRRRLDVVVVFCASQGAADCTKVCGSGAFGERSDRERQCIVVVVAQACTQCCAVGVPCLGHCDDDWGLCRGLGGGGVCASGK